MEGVVLAAFVPKITHENRYGTWVRRIAHMPARASDMPHEATFICLLDEKTMSYGAVLQGALVEVVPSSPAVFTEQWTIQKRSGMKHVNPVKKSIKPSETTDS